MTDNVGELFALLGVENDGDSAQDPGGKAEISECDALCDKESACGEMFLDCPHATENTISERCMRL